MRDYYEILGVSRDCDEAGLKAAFRKAAMQHHPDRNQGCTESEGSFRYAHNGVVYLLARSQTYSPLRRNEQARAARSEMGLVQR